jgi:hypothetical protein
MDPSSSENVGYLVKTQLEIDDLKKEKWKTYLALPTISWYTQHSGRDDNCRLIYKVHISLTISK